MIRLHEALTRTKREMKIGRAVAFEWAGSQRFSQPGYWDLDAKLAEFLPPMGVFLEIGANNGYAMSNTYYLEKVRGWRGILVEPVPRLAKRCRSLRPASHCVNVACVATEGVGPIEISDQDLMSMVVGRGVVRDGSPAEPGHRTLSVETTTLSRVIDDSPYDHVTFMSVDVEGAELDVLAGLDLPRHTPDWLLVETATPEEVIALCGDHLSLAAQLTHHDYLFRAGTTADASRG